MFWIVMLCVGLGLVFVKLGAYSVWMSVLSLAFNIALLIIVVMAIYLVRSHLKSRKRNVVHLPRRND